MNSRFINLWVCQLLCLISAVIFISCGNRGSSSHTDKTAHTVDNGSGAIAFNLKWVNDPELPTSTYGRSKAIDCDASGISAIRAECYNNDTLVGVGQWPCRQKQGTISEVTAGENLNLQLFALNQSGNMVFYGEETGITVTAGNKTHVGEVTMNRVNENETGSYQGKLRFPPQIANIDSNEDTLSVIDCSHAGIDRISYEFSDSTDTFLKGQLTDCSTPDILISDIPVGTQITLVVTATDDMGNVLLRGEEHDISITNTNVRAGKEIDLSYISYTNYFGMTFHAIPPGTFNMGSLDTEEGHQTDEIQHEVRLTSPYYIQTMEVTQGQWRTVMGNNPSYFSACGDACPVENVDWRDAQAFIAELNEMNQGTYRLPTEAEWEYAARARSTAAFSNGLEMDSAATDDQFCLPDDNLDGIGWYCANSEVTYNNCVDIWARGASTCAGPHPVGLKQPNLWGLYDMHGNVWEWCQDRYDTYPEGPVENPTGPDSTSSLLRVLRGGSWYDSARWCRAAQRHTFENDAKRNYGLRLVYLADSSPEIHTDGPPILLSASIEAGGQRWALVFNKPVWFGEGGNTGLSIIMDAAGPVNLTYGSGAGTQRLIYRSNITIEGTDTTSGLSYSQPGDGMEDSGGNDVPSFSDYPLRNTSSVGVARDYFEFTTNGQTWGGYVTCPRGDVTWLFGNGEQFEGQDPGERDFGSTGERTHRVIFSDPDALTRIDLHVVNPESVIGITLGDFANLDFLHLYRCKIEDLDISRCPKLLNLHLNGNAWPPEVGDKILSDLVEFGMSNGEIFIQGLWGSNNQESLNNIEILNERQWSIYP